MTVARGLNLSFKIKEKMTRGYKFLDIINRLDEDFPILDTWFGFSNPTIAMSELILYNPDHYDLVIKPHHLERRIKEKEQQLSNYKSIINHYEEIVKKIEEEIVELKKQLDGNKKAEKPTDAIK